MPPTPVDVFQFSKPSDLLTCLESMIQLHKERPIDPTIAALTAVVSWSIVDWVYKHHGNGLGLESSKELGDKIRKDSYVFGLIQGLGNAFKHGGQVDHPTKIRSAGQEEGVFEGGVYEEGVFVPTHLFLEDDQGQKLECTKAFEETFLYWGKFFHKNNIS